MSMTRLILTDDAFHGGEPAPAPRARPSSIPCVASHAVPRREPDAPAGETPTSPISPAGISSRRPRPGEP